MNESNRNIIIVVAVLAIVACCCVALIVGAVLLGQAGSRLTSDFSGFGTATVGATESFSERFTVDGPARLVADVRVGSIEVVVGDGNSISIEAEARAYGGQSRAQETLSRVQIEASQSGQEIRFTANWPDLANLSQPRSPQVEARITVPANTAVDLKIDVGEVTVTGTRGDVDIQADVGKVTVQDVQVEESLEIETDVADINYAGALTPGANYDVRSDVGSITLSLPADSRFEIDADSDVGNVSVGFEIVGEESRDFVGKRVRGVVGGDSSTTIFLRSDVGAISVRQR